MRGSFNGTDELAIDILSVTIWIRASVFFILIFWFFCTNFVITPGMGNNTMITVKPRNELDETKVLNNIEKRR